MVFNLNNSNTTSINKPILKILYFNEGPMLSALVIMIVTMFKHHHFFPAIFMLCLIIL